MKGESQSSNSSVLCSLPVLLVALVTLVPLLPVFVICIYELPLLLLLCCPFLAVGVIAWHDHVVLMFVTSLPSFSPLTKLSMCFVAVMHDAHLPFIPVSLFLLQVTTMLCGTA